MAWNEVEADGSKSELQAFGSKFSLAFGIGTTSSSSICVSSIDRRIDTNITSVLLSI